MSMRRCSSSRRSRSGSRIISAPQGTVRRLARQTASLRCATYLREDPKRVKACSDCIRVIKVNRKTLTLFDADDLPHLVDNLDRIFRDDMLKTHVSRNSSQLWEGKTDISQQHGQLLAARASGSISSSRAASCRATKETWDRVLVAIEDVTERESARRELAASEDYARGLFEHSPVSLWVEDFSRDKGAARRVRQRGIRDFRVFTDVHPEFVERCMSEIRVIDVNRHTLEIFAAPDKPTLLRRLDEVFRDDMQTQFREQLDRPVEWQAVPAARGGELLARRHRTALHLQFSVLPGRERDWSLVQVALTDITARKKAEAYLEYLGRPRHR